MSRIRANQITNQSADGAPTVQNGLVISGVTTSTTFSGSGASLTNLPAQATIANNADNRVITGGSGVNLNGEANLTFDGSKLSVTSSSKDLLYLNSTHSDGPQIPIQTSGTTFAYIGGAASLFSTGSSTDLGFRAESGKNFLFGIGANERLRIDSSGRVLIGTTTEGSSSADDLTIATTGTTGITIRSGTGNAGNIEFSDGTSGTDEYRGIVQYHHSGDSMRFFTNADERLRINSNGAVGINTVVSDQPNTPSLHLHGSATDDCRISFSTPTKSAPGSRIGYYGLNRFGIDTYDGIEMRDVTRSYATIFKIDNNGYMTTNQPYGYVRFNTIADTGGENRQTDVYTHTVENGMSHSSGRLTVPATGKYYIGIHGNLLDNASCAQYLYINGSKQAGFRWQQNDGTQYWKSSMVGGIVGLTANDYLDVYIVGKQDGHSWNMWTVYMIG